MNDPNKRGRAAMDHEKTVPALRLVIPLPIALYSSNGLLFELYEGGQPSRPHHVVWERLKTTETQSSSGPSSDASANSIRD